MIGPAFYRIENPSRIPTVSCFPGEHSSLLDLVAELLSEMQPEECGHVDTRNPKTQVANHLRHCLATYQAFLDGLPTRKIDYANPRGTLPPHSTCPDVFDHVLALHTRMLQEAASLPPCTRLQVRHDDDWVETTVARESCYLEEHTMHHCMTVATLLQPVPERLIALRETLEGGAKIREEIYC